MEYLDNEDMSNLDISKLNKLNVASKLTELPMNNGSNISPHALGMSVKIELEKRRSTQTLNERNIMYNGTYNKNKIIGISDEISYASNILKKMDENTNTIIFREALATRMNLRNMALKNFSKYNYSDALLESYYSLLLAKKFHMQVRNTPLCGEMAMELLILSKCYAHIGHFHKGMEHLLEFKFLVENTLLQYSKGIESISSDAKYAIIDCDKKLFLSIVYILAEILTNYGMWEDAEIFFSKYLTLYSQIYGEFDISLSNALNNVCIYMLNSKQYLKALPLCIKSLEILKKHFGDYDSDKPNIKVADAYNNLGIVYRLLNNPVDAMQQFFKAIDMKMRIYDDRNHPSVQDIFLSIGCCLHSLGNFTSAASIYKEVYTTRCDNLGKLHSSTISVHQLLKDLQHDLSLKYDNDLEKNKDIYVKNDSEIKIKKQFTTPFVDVSRIRALYSNKLENTKTNLPNIDICNDVVFSTEKLLDLSKQLNTKSLNLPIVNVPMLSKGTLYLKDGLPAMTLNPDAVDLVRQWGFEPPEITVLGELIQNELTDDGISLFVPLVKEDNNMLLGYHNKPIYVPNPAVYHTDKYQNRRRSEIMTQFNNLNKPIVNEGLIKPVKIDKLIQTDVKEVSKDKDIEIKPNDVKKNENDEIKKQPETEDKKNDKQDEDNKDTNLTNNNDNIENKDMDKKEDQTKLDNEMDVDKPSGDLVKSRVGEFERLKSVKFVEKPKVIEEPIVEVPITDIIKNKVKNPHNAKFLAKIGALSNIKVKQNMVPKFDNTIIKKSVIANRMSRQIAKKVPTKRLSHSPKHKTIIPNDNILDNKFNNNYYYQQDSDNDTIFDNNDYILSCSDTPINSDHESFSDYTHTKMVFNTPYVQSFLETSKPLHTNFNNLLPQTTQIISYDLPLVLKSHKDVLPLEIAKKVKLIKTFVNTNFNNFDKLNKDKDKKDEEESNHKDDKQNDSLNKNDNENITSNTATKQPPPLPKSIVPQNNKVDQVNENNDKQDKDTNLTNNKDNIENNNNKQDKENKNKNNEEVNEKLKDLDKNLCVLLDSEGNELAYVPWTIDLLSLSLAKSCLQEDFLNRYSFLSKSNKNYLKKKEIFLRSEIDDEKKKNELLLCRMLLAGEGLEELGFSKIATSMQAITNDLTSGLTFNIPNSVLENIKKQQNILEKQQKDLEELQKKKEEVPKKEVPSKKAPSIGKKAPPPPKGAGKKVPPLKGKGPLPVPGKGGFSKVAKKVPGKAAVESNVRRFFWDPIFGDDAKDTIFSTQKLTPKVEVSKVEESFAKATPKQKDKSQEASKPKFIQLLPDSKRSYNMNIGLSKFSKFSFNEIREAIIHLDPNILTVDTTESLLLLLPNAEELSVMSEFVKSGGDLSMVDKPEQFVAAMVGIPIMKQRLECHQSALTFKDNYNEIYEPLENIMDSCEAIMTSVKLNILSHFILNVGNTLNEGDPKKGNAEGFKPTTYPKLNDFRTTTKPSKTLLQYICDIIGDEDENILDVLDDLKSLDLGSKVDVGALDEKMNRFKNDLTKIKNAINLAQNSKNDFTDHFPSIMNEFLRDAEPKVTSLLKHYQDVMNMFKETVRFTGYTEKEVDKVKPNELFKYIWSFAQSVDLCRKQRIDARNKLERKNQAQTKLETKKVVKQQPKNTKLTAVPKLQNDDMVNIVKAL